MCIDPQVKILRDCSGVTVDRIVMTPGGAGAVCEREKRNVMDGDIMNPTRPPA
jgi:hypothetical protein